MEALFLYLPLMLLALPVFTKYYLNKLQNLPPSPFPTIPILGHLLLIKNPIHTTLSKISATYGPVLLLRFGSRRVLLVSSPAAAEECFNKDNDQVFANRPQLLAGKHFGYRFSNLAWAPHGKLWRKLRRVSCLDILLPCHRLPCLQDIRTNEVRLLVRGIFRKTTKAKGMRTVKMKKKFLELVLNVMMRMFAGKRYFGEEVAETDKARLFKEIVTETFKETGKTNLGDYFPVFELLSEWLGVCWPLEERMIKLQEKRDFFVQDLIDEIKGTTLKKGGSDQLPEEKKTIIEVLLEKQEEDPKNYSDEVIKSSLLVLLAAGTDTSAGTLEWALSLLLNNPQVLKKAQDEIDNYLAGQNRLLEESDIDDLPYLECIIKETLRMYPAAPMLVPHESKKDHDCTVGGYLIPGGTMLLVNMWAIQNDPKVWVEPRKFMPERFEGQERTGFKLMPFGYGRRSCPGEGLAKRMVGLALGSLIQCFEWERIGEEMVDMTEGAGLTLLKAQPLEAKCRPRPAMVNLISQI